MEKKITKIFIWVNILSVAFLFTVGVTSATETVHLQLEGDMQESSGSDMSVDLRAVQADSIGDKEHKDEINILSASATDDEGKEVNEPNTTNIERENIGIVGKSYEDDDKSKNRNMELEFKVEEGEMSADKKSSNIIIKGSKIKENYTVPASGEIRIPEEVETNDDLENYLKKSAYEDENINEVESSDKEVSVKYKMPVKLFWIIPVTMPQKTTVTFSDIGQSRVKVKFPWWRIFAKEFISEHDMEESIESEIDIAKLNEDLRGEEGGPDKPIVVGSQAETNENVTLNFAEVKADLIKVILNNMKTKHDTVKSSISNIR